MTHSPPGPSQPEASQSKESDASIGTTSSELEAMEDSPEYVPTSSTPPDDSTSDPYSQEEGPCEMQKYIVFSDNLDSLHKFCNQCGSPVTEKSKRTTGSMISYSITCHAGHKYTWRSQPVQHRQPVGNLLISAAILTTGNTFAKIKAFADSLNLQLFSHTLYNKIQKEKLLPVIQEDWEKEKAVEEVKSLGPVVLAGDGRCDTPGHCAKYGTYSLMHVDREQIFFSQTGLPL